jgi:hypothetical protein
MPLSQAPVLKAESAPYLREAEEVCPLCEQPLPADRLEEIKERIQIRERELADEITARLKMQFAREKAEVIETARREGAAALAREKEAGSAREVAARAEGRQAAEAAAQEKIAAAERAAKEAQAAMQTRIEQVEAAKAAAEQNRTALRQQLEQTRRDHEAAIAKVKQDASARENTIRKEAASQAEAALQERIKQAEQAKAEAENKAAAADQQARLLKETHDAQLAQRLEEQRVVYEKDKTDAVNAERSARFEEKLKFSTKIEELQRTIDKKTAEELGEGAEIDLYEALKTEFEVDRIERINKGLPGADILHTVFHNGKECGKIIYDSKNHNAWRNEFVTKLAVDQMAAKAEHAILSTRKFPSGARHLHIQNGVILASPSRVVALVQIVRQHLIQTHTLRMSNEARAQKTAALYTFITSERCTDLFARIDTHADGLLDLQAKEVKWHQTNWNRQGELLRSIQKVRAELCNEIDIIIGTAGENDEASNG